MAKKKRSDVNKKKDVKKQPKKELKKLPKKPPKKVPEKKKPEVVKADPKKIIKKEPKGPRPLFEMNIAEKGYNSYFKLKVYKDYRSLNKAINQANGDKGKHIHEDCCCYAGMVIEEMMLKEEVATDDDIVCQFATCYLSAEGLSHSIIAHEALHVALVNERLLKRYVGGYKNEDAKFGNVPEERLAYCLESYVSAITAICKKNNVKIEDE